jgi:hypothetical protein
VKTPASFAAVQAVVANRTAAKLIWPSERGTGRKELLLDGFTASAIVAVHSVVNAENKAKLERMCAASKGQFVKVANFALSKAGPA